MKHKFSFLALLFFISIACQKNEKQTTFRLNWTEVESIPASFGNISKGVSASFVGLLDEKLIVAGGCNFPDISAAEGGKKVFYKDILLFDRNNWEKIGELPEPLAYGISVTTEDIANTYEKEKLINRRQEILESLKNAQNLSSEELPLPNSALFT